MPHGGLALANSLATGLEAICLFFLMRRRLAGIEGERVLKGAIQAILATMVMVLVIGGWLVFAEEQPVWIIAVGGILFGGGVYGLLILLIRVPEAKSMINIMKRRLLPANR